MVVSAGGGGAPLGVVGVLVSVGVVVAPVSEEPVSPELGAPVEPESLGVVGGVSGVTGVTGTGTAGGGAGGAGLPKISCRQL